ncbi:MAG: helix-turn-helix domain-containing protein [Coriobacteriia bacterium]
MAITPRTARIMKNMTQEEVAAKLGIRASVYQHFEQDLGPMRIAQLERLAEILGVTPSDLLVSRCSTDSSYEGEIKNQHEAGNEGEEARP